MDIEQKERKNSCAQYIGADRGARAGALRRLWRALSKAQGREGAS